MDNNSVLPEENTEITEVTETAEEQPKQPVSRRYDKKGRRRGRYGAMASLGWLITLLSLIGVVAVVVTGVSLVRRATDTTALKEEFYYYLEPVLSYNPVPFEDVTVTEQDAFLQAATYRVALAEQNRMLFEHDESCRYAVDDTGRIAVPVEEVEASYNALFGTESPLTHRSLEKDNILYSSSDNCYYVPFQSLATGYTAVVDSVKRRGSSYTVRVGFVANGDVKINEHGKEISPTADMATYFQTYTLVETDEGYYINACVNE